MPLKSAGMLLVFRPASGRGVSRRCTCEPCRQEQTGKNQCASDEVAELDLLPRTHWNPSLTFSRDLDRETDEVTRTLLLQLHLYL